MRVYAHNASQRFLGPLHGLSPAQRLFNRVLAATLVLMVFNSVNFSAGAYDVGGNYMEGFDLEIDASEIGLVEDGGYLVSSSPSSTEATRYLDRKEEVSHQVQPGETLSNISYMYGLNVNTIFWANQDKINNINALRVGQELKIPVVDGVKITVKKGETLADLVKRYKGEEEGTKTLVWNAIAGDGSLREGQQLMIVGGKPYVEVAKPRYTSTAGRGVGASGPSPAPSGSVVPLPGGQGWIKPVSGTFTQGFHRGHYGFDIAGPMGTPILAAGSGVVTRTSYGWGGGYGNHVIIQHDNGCETLYAHNSQIHVVQGQTVSAGQVVSSMGNTGRVYGRTGIHLHFELHCNGQKVNPAVVFGW